MAVRQRESTHQITAHEEKTDPNHASLLRAPTSFSFTPQQALSVANALISAVSSNGMQQNSLLSIDLPVNNQLIADIDSHPPNETSLQNEI